MPHEAGYDSFLSGFGQYLSICLFLRLCRNDSIIRELRKPQQ